MTTDECSDECLEALRRLETFLDGELEDLTASQLREHLSDCGPCTDRVDVQTKLRELVRRGCVDEAPPQLRARILATLDEVSATPS